MKHTLILILAAVYLVSCDKQGSYRTIHTHYADCEIVEDYDYDYRYFIRKPDGTIISIRYDGVGEDLSKTALEASEILIFKPKL